MSVNNNRMKWWEKYCNKEVNQDIDRNPAVLRDLLRATFLRLLHAKVDALDIDEMIDNIIQKTQGVHNHD